MAQAASWPSFDTRGFRPRAQDEAAEEPHGRLPHLPAPSTACRASCCGSKALALAAAAVYAYHRLGGSWWLFACLILVPDVSLLAYLGGTRLGAIAYNAFHVTLGPLVCAALGFLLPSFDLIQVALIWAAHVGIDRALGLGLKYNAGFGFTHLGRIGGAMTGS